MFLYFENKKKISIPWWVTIILKTVLPQALETIIKEPSIMC